MDLQQPAQNTVADLAEPLPAHVESALWRGGELRPPPTAIYPSGWKQLDAELPGGGWPGLCVTELLVPQPGILEWRLLGPALKPIVDDDGEVAVVGPARPPGMAGLVQDGINPDTFWRYNVDEPARRLWVTEQILKTNGADVLIAWLPQARSEQVRRLQACATGFEGLCVLVRPAHVLRDSSPAPLRVCASLGPDWDLRVRIAKRRGPTHEEDLLLSALSGGLANVLAPELLHPSQFEEKPIPEVPSHAVGSTQNAVSARHTASH
jgi:protein ImuA